MWAYVLIAVEISLFYTLFWYYFVREPKPFKVIGNPWGRYGDPSSTAGGAQSRSPFTTEVTRGEFDSQTYRDRKQEAVSRLHRRRCRRIKAISRAHLPEHLFQSAENNRPGLKRFLSLFTSALWHRSQA